MRSLSPQIYINISRTHLQSAEFIATFDFCISRFLAYKSPHPAAVEHQTVTSFLSLYNMKFLIVFVALFALAVARPNDVQTVRQDSDVQPDKWSSVLETSDGTSIDQQGVLKDVGTEHEAAVVHGSFSWVDEKTGEKFTITYVADENGYQPQGAHLPVAPVA